MARLFNAYVIVDWSAASKVGAGADSVHIGLLRRDVRFRLTFESFAPASRAEAEKRLAAILEERRKHGDKTFLGLNFPLGFPRGLAAGLKLAGDPPWSALWDQLDKMVKDKADNTNNRFGVGAEINRRLSDGPFPFWGAAPRDTLTTLQPKRQRDHGEGDVPEFRHTEAGTKAAPIWKLYYAGAVGGHAILGIPMVRRLKKARAEAMKVWPFETGFKALAPADLDGVDLLAAEVSLALNPTAPAAGETKEAAAVRAQAERLAKLDEAGKLGEAFAPPKGLDADIIATAEHEEGWTLTA